MITPNQLEAQPLSIPVVVQQWGLAVWLGENWITPRVFPPLFSLSQQQAARGCKLSPGVIGISCAVNTLHRVSVGQGPSGHGWLTTALGFWSSGWALATGAAWAGLCLVYHQHHSSHASVA